MGTEHAQKQLSSVERVASVVRLWDVGFLGFAVVLMASGWLIQRRSTRGS